MSEWEHQEAGWYTKRGIGGVVLEDGRHAWERGWWFHAAVGRSSVGPFKTASEAMAAASSVLVETETEQA